MSDPPPYHAHTRWTPPRRTPHRASSPLMTSQCGFGKEQERSWLVHIARLANTLLNDEESARDNHVLACNFATDFKKNH